MLPTTKRKKEKRAHLADTTPAGSRRESVVGGMQSTPEIPRNLKQVFVTLREGIVKTYNFVLQGDMGDAKAELEQILQQIKKIDPQQTKVLLQNLHDAMSEYHAGNLNELHGLGLNADLKKGAEAFIFISLFLARCYAPIEAQGPKALHQLRLAVDQMKDLQPEKINKIRERINLVYPWDKESWERVERHLEKYLQENSIADASKVISEVILLARYVKDMVPKDIILKLKKYQYRFKNPDEFIALAEVVYRAMSKNNPSIRWKSYLLDRSLDIDPLNRQAIYRVFLTSAPPPSEADVDACITPAELMADKATADQLDKLTERYPHLWLRWIENHSHQHDNGALQRQREGGIKGQQFVHQQKEIENRILEIDAEFKQINDKLFNSDTSDAEMGQLNVKRAELGKEKDQLERQLPTLRVEIVKYQEHMSAEGFSQKLTNILDLWKKFSDNDSEPLKTYASLFLALYYSSIDSSVEASHYFSRVDASVVESKREVLGLEKISNDLLSKVVQCCAHLSDNAQKIFVVFKLDEHLEKLKLEALYRFVLLQGDKVLLNGPGTPLLGEALRFFDDGYTEEYPFLSKLNFPDFLRYAYDVPEQVCNRISDLVSSIAKRKDELIQLLTDVTVPADHLVSLLNFLPDTQQAIDLVAKPQEGAASLAVRLKAISPQTKVLVGSHSYHVLCALLSDHNWVKSCTPQQLQTLVSKIEPGQLAEIWRTHQDKLESADASTVASMAHLLVGLLSYQHGEAQVKEGVEKTALEYRVELYAQLMGMSEGQLKIDFLSFESLSAIIESYDPLLVSFADNGDGKIKGREALYKFFMVLFAQSPLIDRLINDRFSEDENWLANFSDYCAALLTDADPIIQSASRKVLNRLEHFAEGRLASDEFREQLQAKLNRGYLQKYKRWLGDNALADSVEVGVWIQKIMGNPEEFAKLTVSDIRDLIKCYVSIFDKNIDERSKQLKQQLKQLRSGERELAAQLDRHTKLLSRIQLEDEKNPGVDGEMHKLRGAITDCEQQLAHLQRSNNAKKEHDLLENLKRNIDDLPAAYAHLSAEDKNKLRENAKKKLVEYRLTELNKTNFLGLHSPTGSRHHLSHELGAGRLTDSQQLYDANGESIGTLGRDGVARTQYTMLGVLSQDQRQVLGQKGNLVGTINDYDELVIDRKTVGYIEFDNEEISSLHEEKYEAAKPKLSGIIYSDAPEEITSSQVQDTNVEYVYDPATIIGSIDEKGHIHLGKMVKQAGQQVYNHQHELVGVLSPEGRVQQERAFSADDLLDILFFGSMADVKKFLNSGFFGSGETTNSIFEEIVADKNLRSTGGSTSGIERFFAELSGSSKERQELLLPKFLSFLTTIHPVLSKMEWAVVLDSCAIVQISEILQAYSKQQSQKVKQSAKPLLLAALAHQGYVGYLMGAETSKLYLLKMLTASGLAESDVTNLIEDSSLSDTLKNLLRFHLLLHSVKANAPLDANAKSLIKKIDFTVMPSASIIGLNKEVRIKILPLLLAYNCSEEVIKHFSNGFDFADKKIIFDAILTEDTDYSLKTKEGRYRIEKRLKGIIDSASFGLTGLLDYIAQQNVSIQRNFARFVLHSAALSNQVWDASDADKQKFYQLIAKIFPCDYVGHLRVDQTPFGEKKKEYLDFPVEGRRLLYRSIETQWDVFKDAVSKFDPQLFPEAARDWIRFYLKGLVSRRIKAQNSTPVTREHSKELIAMAGSQGIIDIFQYPRQKLVGLAGVHESLLEYVPTYIVGWSNAQSEQVSQSKKTLEYVQKITGVYMARTLDGQSKMLEFMGSNCETLKKFALASLLSSYNSLEYLSTRRSNFVQCNLDLLVAEVNFSQSQVEKDATAQNLKNYSKDPQRVALYQEGHFFRKLFNLKPSVPKYVVMQAENASQNVVRAEERCEVPRVKQLTAQQDVDGVKKVMSCFQAQGTAAVTNHFKMLGGERVEGKATRHCENIVLLAKLCEDYKADAMLTDETITIAKAAKKEAEREIKKAEWSASANPFKKIGSALWKGWDWLTGYKPEYVVPAKTDHKHTVSGQVQMPVTVRAESGNQDIEGRMGGRIHSSVNGLGSRRNTANNRPSSRVEGVAAQIMEEVDDEVQQQGMPSFVPQSSTPPATRSPAAA